MQKGSENMNRIFKVIWSKTRNCYVVASELAKGRTKAASTGDKAKRLALAAITALMLLPVGGYSYAEDTTKVEPASDTATATVEVYTKDGANNTFATINNLSAVSTEVHTQSTQVNTNATNIKSNTDKISKLESAVGDDDSGLKKDVNDLKTTVGDSTVGLVKDVADSKTAIDTEAKAREAGDKTLDDRITAVKNYVLNETGNHYVSKADAAVQDAGVVKADKKIGENVTALGKGLYDETAARIGADAAQDKVIQAVNDNLVQSVTTINKNVADGFTALNQADANEAAAREAKDNELNERITNEANAIHKTTNKLQDDLNTETTAREAADTALDTRITNVKEYLEKQTSDKYVSKDDAAVQDGAIVKAANTIGDNVTKLDAALASETAARIGADKAQDKVIQQVNQNMVDGFNTINTNMANGFAALNQADANEAAARVAADTKLVEAVNSGLSLSDKNVLQKNKTSVAADGTVTTSKEAATTLVMNEGTENQITLSENGIKVGLNSTVQDANGFYAGGDTAAAAKAALNADGSIKGANGAFAVDTSGNVTSGNVTSTGTVTGKSLTDGTASLSGGNLTGAHNVTADGTITGATLTDGKATISNGNIKTNGGYIQTDGGNVNTQGGEVRTNGGKVATSGGEINTGSGAIKTVGGDILTAGGKLSTSGGDIAAGTGNISGQNITASGVLSGDSLTVAKGMTGHSLTLTGGDLDAGAGTIKTTGKVQAGTLETTGDATIGGDLDVKGDLSVEGKFNANTLSSKLDENNYTEIHGGNVTSVNSKVDTTDGKTYTSTATLTEKGKTETASNGINRNVEKMDATESSNVISNDANGQNSTFKQRVDEILNQINSSDTVFSKVDQKVDNITSEVTDGTNTTSSAQTTTDITNTAKQGTITNEAQNLVNKASDTISNEAANNITNTSTNGNISNTANNGTISNTAKNIENTASENITNTAKNGSITNDAKNIANIASETLSNSAKNMTNTIGKNLTTTVGGDMSTEVTGNQSNTVKGTLTETVTGDVTEDYKANLSTTVGGNQTTTVTGDSSLTAENINNTAKNKITNKAIDVETDASSSIVNKVSNDAGSNTSTQLSYETKEEMSQADGKTASYLRGAAEEKSQLTDGDKKTTIDTVAGQTNTNITEGKNISNSLQKADQVASSVTDGTNTTVVNQDAKRLASSITDGTKANNSSNTVDKSEQLIKASDTQYSATTKTATKMEDALVSGSNIIDVIKGLDAAGNPLISSAVTDGTTITGISQNAKDINLSATGGTITNDAQNITNKAAETLSNSAKNIANKTTEDMTNTIGKNLKTTVGGDMSTEVTGSQSTTVKGNQSNTVEGTLTETVTGKATENYNGGLETTITVEEKHTVNGNQTNNITGNQTNTIGGAQTTTITGDSSLSAQNITNTASEKITNQIGDGSAVKSEMTADGITNTAEGGTIYNKSKDILNEASGDILNFADGEIGNSATKITNLTGDNTVTSDTNGTTFENKAHSTAVKKGTVTKTTISGNTITTGEAVMDYADVMKDLGVRGNAAVDGNTTLGKEGAETTLTVNSTSTFNKDVTMKENATVAKDLSVGGNASVSGSVTASSYKVGDKTYISESGINANDQKVVNVAPGRIAADSKDAVNGSQLYQTNERVTSVENRVGTVENRVDKLDSRVDKVGANAAALANLHPLEFDADSKWNIAAAVGGYKGETATAIGAFYRPNENVMVNVSSSFGTGENMYGGGISLRIGQGGNKARRNATNGLTEREKAMQKQIDSLTSRLDALLSVINPNMSKDFPDVPENHWAYEAVSRLAGNGVIQGYEDGKYHGDRTMTRYEMAEIIYNALSKGAKAEKKLVEEFKPELQAMAAQKKA